MSCHMRQFSLQFGVSGQSFCFFFFFFRGILGIKSHVL